MKFEINKDFKPKSGQDKTVGRLIQSIEKGAGRMTLLGATGTGKTFMMAETVRRLNRPALIIAPNKTLASQLYFEFKNLFPKNAVEYFVSYYDYYQPEAYVVSQDLFIEKDALINEEIDRMRHSATHALLTRQDTVVVASVSAIYGLGDPNNYKNSSWQIEKLKSYPRKEVLKKLTEMNYQRNDTTLIRGGFSVTGEKIEIWPSDTNFAIRILFWGDEIEKIEDFSPVTEEIFKTRDRFMLMPASHYAIQEKEIKRVTQEIQKELDHHLADMLALDKNLEAARLEKRVGYDIEMLEEAGFVSGIENYSRIFDKRSPGEPPYTLLDYFPDDFICFIDESHVSIPQIDGMYKGDRSRKEVLVEHGFRLPSALDNRPLKFNEFLKRAPTIVAVSATPGDWERKSAPVAAEQLIRPTGILDPKIEVRPKENQVKDVIREIEKEEGRVLVTTITKKMAEKLSDYLIDRGVKASYLHSDIDTLERVEIINNLRAGRIEALIGVNLLREGLDLPEVSLVIVLDADQEGFLRNETSLIQTSGRAARNINGRVIFYADKETDSIKKAITETFRRRKIQKDYNQKNKIKPSSIQKEVVQAKELSKKEVSQILTEIEIACDELRFEDAARLRDQIQPRS